MWGWGTPAPFAIGQWAGPSDANVLSWKPGVACGWRDIRFSEVILVQTQRALLCLSFEMLIGLILGFLRVRYLSWLSCGPYRLTTAEALGQMG